jgi:hypothetical protein
MSDVASPRLALQLPTSSAALDINGPSPPLSARSRRRRHRRSASSESGESDSSELRGRSTHAPAPASAAPSAAALDDRSDESGSESSSGSGLRKTRNRVRRRKETSALVADALGVARSPRTSGFTVASMATSAAVAASVVPATTAGGSAPPMSGSAKSSARKSVFGGMFGRNSSNGSSPTRVSDRELSAAGALPSPAAVLPNVSLLFVAAKANDVDQVRRLVDELPKSVDTATLRNRAQLSQTPLHVTASVACARHLAARLPTLPELPDEFGELPLHTAVRHGRLEVAQFLLSLPGAGDTCKGVLHRLARVPWSGRPDCAAARLFELLLSVGAQLSERDRRGCTPIHRAAAHGNWHAVSAMLALGDRSLRYLQDDARNTPLVHAARGGHVDVLRLLMRDGEKGKLDTSRAAAIASQWHRTAVLDLLKHDAPVAAPAAASAQQHSAPAPRESLWACSLLAGLDDAAAATDDDDHRLPVSASVAMALPATLELLRIAPTKKARRAKTSKQSRLSTAGPLEPASIAAVAATALAGSQRTKSAKGSNA